MNATAKGFRCVVAVLFLAASWGVANQASADLGGGNAEPGGNTPTGFKLSGPAITGQMTLIQNYVGENRVLGSTLRFVGSCKGKEIVFEEQNWASKKFVRDHTRYCSGDVNDCITNGGYVESTVLAINADTMFPALASAGCDDVFYRHPEQFSYIQLFVQAVPYFRYDRTDDVLYSDVVLLFLVPTAP